MNSLANFTFQSLETNRRISDRQPADYMPEIQERQPGALESHWIPVEPDLWVPERYPEFLERRRVLLADAVNRFLAELDSGDRGEEPEGSAVEAAPHLHEVPLDNEERLIEEVQAWANENGFDVGERDHELVNADGEQIAVLDVAWPRGLQVELSEPVALLIDEPVDVLEAAARNGYRAFTDPEEFRTYASRLAA